MAERPDQEAMGQEDAENPSLSIAARHALHDEELIAAYATDDAAADDAARASSLVDRCQACHELYADLVAIGAVLRAEPNASAIASARHAPRDFRLSVATANELRPGSAVLRLRDRIRAAIAAFSRPIGLSMASLGVVGLLLGSLTLGGTASLGPAPQDVGGAGAAEFSSAPASTAEGLRATRQPGADSGLVVSGPAESSRTTFGTLSTASPPSVPPPAAQGASPNGAPTLSTLIVVGSIVLLVGGVAVLVFGTRRGEPSPGR